MEVLRAKNVEGVKKEWDASPESIKATALKEAESILTIAGNLNHLKGV